MNHTPGPWMQYGTIIGSEVGKLAICRMLDGTNTDAPLLELGSSRWAIQMNNAHLIAAAPDLLDSCKELRDALAAAMRVMFNAGLSQIWVEAFNALNIADGLGVRADSIIARAEGRA
jgi:hypothetical protein